MSRCQTCKCFDKEQQEARAYHYNSKINSYSKGRGHGLRLAESGCALFQRVLKKPDTDPGKNNRIQIRI